MLEKVIMPQLPTAVKCNFADFYLILMVDL